VVVAASLAACGADKTQPPKTKQASVPLFADVTEQVGLHFHHNNGMSGEFYYPEIIGAGVALFDYNNDGRLDMLVMQGEPLTAGKKTGSSATCLARLYRNDAVDSPDGTHAFKFTDVTESSHLCTRGYGMGVAVGDIDNDGFVDVFVTHFGAPNQLFRNNGNGTFTDITQKIRRRRSGEVGQQRDVLRLRSRRSSRLVCRELRRLRARKKPEMLCEHERARLLRAVGLPARAGHPLSQSR
jgi:hypothetical protein